MFKMKLELTQQRNLNITVPRFISTIFDDNFILLEFKKHENPNNPIDDFCSLVICESLCQNEDAAIL